MREWWLLIIQRAQLLLHHAVNSARWAALHVSGGSPPSWADWVNRSRPHAPRARHAAEISSTREISASASRVRPDVREINCRLWNCGMLGACSARGLKYIHLFSRTQTRMSPSPPHRRDPSACWIPDEHQPPPPLPSEVLLLCLQVVLPGILPIASRFHVARGIILPFVCTCASAGVCALHRSVTPSQALSFISVFCSGSGPASHLWGRLR